MIPSCKVSLTIKLYILFWNLFFLMYYVFQSYVLYKTFYIYIKIKIYNNITNIIRKYRIQFEPMETFNNELRSFKRNFQLPKNRNNKLKNRVRLYEFIYKIVI